MQRRFAQNLILKKGSIVCLAVDFRDRSQTNPSGILCVAFDVNLSTGGIRVVCEHGVIGSGKNGKSPYWAPYAPIKRTTKRETIVWVSVQSPVSIDAANKATSDAMPAAGLSSAANNVWPPMSRMR